MRRSLVSEHSQSTTSLDMLGIQDWKSILLFYFRDAKVIRDANTNKSKGYGFVSFVNKKVSLESLIFLKNNFNQFILKTIEKVGF